MNRSMPVTKLEVIGRQKKRGFRNFIEANCPQAAHRGMFDLSPLGGSQPD
jgi:hypothetical protein